MVKKREIKKSEEKTEKEEGKLSKKQEKKQTKQFIAILICIVFILAIVFGAWFAIQSSKKFDYYGIKFEKVMYDKFPLFFSDLSFLREDGSKINYHLYLRNDPRTNLIPADAEINFKRGIIYVSQDKESTECEDSVLAMTNIGQFIFGLGFQAKGATSDKELADLIGYPLITCSDSGNNTVISYEKADESGITQKGECYILKVNNCDMVNVTERFILETLKQRWV